MEDDDRFWRFAGLGLMTALAGCCVLILFAWSVRVPTDAEAAAIARPGLLIAYQTEDGHRPSLLVVDDDLMLFEPLSLDRLELLAFDPPAWKADAIWEVGSTTGEAANAFVYGCVEVNLRCPGKAYFGGQVNDPRIASVEVQIDRRWTEFTAHPPGYLWRLPSGKVIGDIRWLDLEGRVVWSIDRNGDGGIGSGDCLRQTFQMLDRSGEIISTRECLQDEPA